MSISLEPEIITSVLGVRLSNTILATALTDAVLLLIVFLVYKNLSSVPGFLQNVFELVIDTLHSLTEQIAGKFTNSIFPWFASFFLFIFFANILALLPGFGAFGFFHMKGDEKEFIPLFRAATSDFNTTLGLATVSIVATHTLSIKYNGIVGYLKRYISLNPIYLFVGVLELISEGTKLFSLSFRLFGNIYAGEVVLSTISSLFAYIAPIPFLLLESIVAFVQALVFSMLTMVFMSILITPHSEGGEH